MLDKHAFRSNAVRPNAVQMPVAKRQVVDTLIGTKLSFALDVRATRPIKERGDLLSAFDEQRALAKVGESTWAVPRVRRQASGGGAHDRLHAMRIA